MPQRWVRIVTQSGAGSPGSGRSFKASVERGPKKSRLSTLPSRLVTTSLGALKSVTSARTRLQSHAAASRTSARPALSTGRTVRHHAGVATSMTNPRRAIPSVERLLRAPAGAALAARYRRERVVESFRAVLETLRTAAASGEPVPADDYIVGRVSARLAAAAAPRLVRVVNATGVV